MMHHTLHRVPRAGSGPGSPSRARGNTSAKTRSARDWIPAFAGNTAARFRALAATVLCLAITACASAQTPRIADNNLPPDALRADAAAAGWNAAALDDVVAFVKSQNSTGFLIIDRERIIVEHNWPLSADATTFRANFVHGESADGALLEDVASMQKSFIAVLVGVAVDKKLIDISKPVSAYIGAGWSKATPQQEAAITVRNLMEMNSGLGTGFRYLSPPGTVFLYNTPVYATLKQVLEKASGKPLDVITADWLTTPTGMKDSGWRKRPAAFADAGNPTGLVTSPRDMARFGQIVLDRGKAADGTRVISAGQLNALFERSKPNPAYGRLWWLNGSSTYVLAGTSEVGEDPSASVSGQLIKDAPADLVAAQGAQGRKLYIVPSRNLIVVRTGAQPAAPRKFNDELWSRLVKAMPKR